MKRGHANLFGQDLLTSITVGSLLNAFGDRNISSALLPLLQHSIPI